MITDNEYLLYREKLNKFGFVKIENFLSKEIIDLYKIGLDLTKQNSEETHSYVNGRVEFVGGNQTLGDCILLFCRPIIEKVYGIENMIPSYSFAREYFRGSSLVCHRDRDACQYSISVTMHKKGTGRSTLSFSNSQDQTEPVHIDMEEGDAVIFDGTIPFDGKWHWREPLEAESSVQLLLHYVHHDNRKAADISFPQPEYRNNIF